MRGDAALAPTQDSVQAVPAAARVAARTRLPLVAAARRVIEIGASRALQQVPGRPSRRCAAGLRRLESSASATAGKRLPRRGYRRGRRCVPARLCALRHPAAARSWSSPGQANTDIDQLLWADDAAFHQVDEVGAGRQVGAAGDGGSRDGFRHGGRPDIVPAASRSSSPRSA